MEQQNINTISFMPLVDFEVQCELGHGAFATVYRCRRKLDGKVYALKKINIGNLPSKDRVNSLNQIRILASVSGSNIIEYKEAFYDEDSSCLCIIMEYAPHGDLMSRINRHKDCGTMFPEKEIWRTAYDILKGPSLGYLGLRVLHNAKILHRDIKSANIFLSEDVAKIGDLNISKMLHSDMATTQTGTPYYTCPEVWKDLPYGFKGDVWSLGCVIYEMCMLKPPFRAQQFEGLYQKVTQGIYDKISFVYSANLNMFIARCLTVDQKLRASVDDLLNSHFFKEFRLAAQKRQSMELSNEMLQTMEFPKNLADINNIVPEPQYDRKLKKKPKTVVIVDSHEEDIKETENNVFGKTLQPLDCLSRKPMKSQKLLPPVLPTNGSKSLKLIGQGCQKSTSPPKAAMRIRKPLKSKIIT